MLERRRCATDRVEGRWNARCRTSGGGGGGIGDRDGKDVAGTGEGGAGRRGRVGNKLWREECGAHVHRICVWKERGTHRVVDRARKIVPFLRFTRENLSKKKIYICIRVKRSRFKIISLTCFTIFNYFRVVNARWIPD